MEILLQCRPGFEAECAEEATSRFQGKSSATAQFKRDSGFVRVNALAPKDFYQTLHWKDMIFARQWWCITQEIFFEGNDRLSPILDIARQLCSKERKPFQKVFCELPDSNDGRQTTKFLKGFEPILESTLQEQKLLIDSSEGNILCLFWITPLHCILGMADERSAPWPQGFPRLRFPGEAPSRSTLKLAEAFEVFLSPREQDLWLRSGMSAVDLGAAPGGWTWQLVSRGIRVTAIDNGPLKGALIGHPNVTHLKEDGFRYRPRHAVDWLVCDMVEKPERIVGLMLEWFTKGLTQMAIFNLKLQEHPRLGITLDCLEILRSGFEKAGLRGRIIARQLYHDREEITVYLRKEGKAQAKTW